MIFVTGGTGMVGAHLLYDLVSQGKKVRALIRKGSTTQRTEKVFSFYQVEIQSLMQHIEWVEGDLLDKDQLRGHLKGIDQIYHVAAKVSFDPNDRTEMLHDNCEGTANLADIALSMHIARFCHVSSISAIGTPPEGIAANENHPWRTNSEHSGYAISKYLAEMEVWRASFEGLNVVIVNPSVILGPGDWKSGSPQFFSAVWRGLRFYTKGGTGFVDVRDVTSAMQQLMADNAWESTKNQRYILNAENVPFREIFNRMAIALHVPKPKYFAGELLLHLAWRFASVTSFLTGKRLYITRETARSANKFSDYDGSKITRTIGFQYRQVDRSISDFSGFFLKEFGEK